MTTLRPVFQSVLQPVLRGVFDPAAVVGARAPSLTNQVIARFGSTIAGMYDFVTTRGLFQDADGTNPVTGYGQPIGLVRNRMLNSYEWEEVPPDTEGPAVFRQPDEPQITGVRRNLSNNFGNFGGTNNTVNVTREQTNIVAPSGDIAWRVRETDNLAQRPFPIWNPQTNLPAGRYTFSLILKADGRSVVNLGNNTHSEWGAWHWAAFDLESGVVLGGAAASRAAITSLGSGWYRCSITEDSVDTISNTSPMRIKLSDGQVREAPIYQGDGVSGVLIASDQFEVGELTPYQAVRSPTDFDGSGLPVGSIWYKTNASDEVIGTYRFTGNPRPVDASDLRQATTAARPTFTERGALHDGVDDTLRAALAGDWKFLHDGSGGALGVSSIYLGGGTGANGYIGTQTASALTTGVAIGQQNVVIERSNVRFSNGSENLAVGSSATGSVKTGALHTEIMVSSSEGVRSLLDGVEYTNKDYDSFVPSSDNPASALTTFITPTSQSLVRRRIIAIREAITDPADILLLDAWLREGME